MESTKRVVVGIFVIVCLLLFGVGLFLIGNSNQLFTKSFHVYADFSKITGIQNGGKVRVAGMDAGTVTRIEVPSGPTGKFRIHFRVIEKLHPIVRQNSVASIQTDGLLGNKYLQIDAGSTTSELARDNSQIQSAEPFDWGDLMDEIRTAVKQVNGILEGVKDQLTLTLSQIDGVVKSANLMIGHATPQVDAILASAGKIGASLREVIDGLQAGQGTVGGLLKDQDLYDRVKRSVDKTERIVDALGETSSSAKKVAKTLEDSDIVPEVRRTIKTLNEITLQVKSAVDTFQSASGEGGVAENLQRTLTDAHEAMSDLSDNTEALKHNFLFRGFFKRRGFYDLGALTAAEYRSPAFAKGFKRHRIWLESTNLFSRNLKGGQTLTVEGKAKLDEAMTEILKFPRNGPLIIEGFSGEGTPAQQFLLGRERANRVEAYLMLRFHLRPAYTGVISMSAESAGDAGAGGFKEGVAIVSYYK